METNNNPFDGIPLPSEAPAPTGKAPTNNPFDGVSLDAKENQINQMKGSMFVAGQTTPDRAAEAVTIAKQYSVDPNFVHDHLDEFKKANNGFDYEGVASNYPGVTAFFQKPENASIAHDDLEPVKQIDRATAFLSGIKDDAAHAVSSGFNDFQRSMITVAAAHGLLDPEVAKTQIESLDREKAALDAHKPDYLSVFQKEFEASGKDLGVSLSNFTKSYQELKRGEVLGALKDYYRGEIQTTGSVLDLAATAALNPQAAAYSAVEGLVPLTPSLALSAAPGVGVAARFGLTFLGGAPVFVGQKFNQIATERGLTTEEALSDPKVLAEVRSAADRYGLTMAAVNAGAPFLAGTFAKTGGAKLVETAADKALTLGSNVAKAAGDVALQAGAFGAGHVVSNVVAGEKPDVQGAIQNAIMMLGPAVAFEALHFAKPRESVSPGPQDIIAPEAAAPEGAAHEGSAQQKLLTTSKRDSYSSDPVQAASEVAHDTSEAVQTLHDLQALDEMSAAVKESKLAKRVPDKIAELVEASGGNGNVFFQSSDWDQYWTKAGLSPAKAAEQIMGDGAEAYMRAKETGEPLRIPLSDYVSKVAPTEHFDGLLGVLKTRETGMNFNEANEHLQSLPETMKSVAADSVKIVDEAKQIADQTRDQLIAAGRPATEAKASAQLLASRLRARSSITGISPKDYFAKYGLEVTGDQGSALAEQPKQILEQSEIPPKGLEFQRYLETPQAKEDYAKIPETMNGNVIGQDIARGLLPEYNQGRESRILHMEATQRPTIKFTQDLYDQALNRKNPGTAHIIMGANGVGKSTTIYGDLAPRLKGSDFAFETIGRDYNRAAQNISAALKKGWNVHLTFVYRPLDEAIDGILHRFQTQGRNVSAERTANGHVNSNETFLNLNDRFKSNPHFSIEIINNSKGLEGQPMTLTELKKTGYIRGDETAQKTIQRLLPSIQERLQSADDEVARIRSGSGSEVQNGLGGSASAGEGQGLPGSSSLSDKKLFQSRNKNSGLLDFESAFKQKKQVQLSNKKLPEGYSVVKTSTVLKDGFDPVKEKYAVLDPSGRLSGMSSTPKKALNEFSRLTKKYGTNEEKAAEDDKFSQVTAEDGELSESDLKIIEDRIDQISELLLRPDVTAEESDRLGMELEAATQRIDASLGLPGFEKQLIEKGLKGSDVERAIAEAHALMDKTGSASEAFQTILGKINRKIVKLFQGPNDSGPRSDKKLFQSARENAPIFYHKLQNVIEEKMGNSATVEQVRALTRDLKPEEVQYSGLNQFLEGKTKVSKADLLDFLRENQIEIEEIEKSDKPEWVVIDRSGEESDTFSTKERAEAFADRIQKEYPNERFVVEQKDVEGGTKFSKYTLPGGENYREVLLTLPGNEYQSSHFDEKGVIAHVRLTDRTGIASGPVKAEVNEARSNRLSTDAKTLSNLVESKSFASKGLGGLKAEQKKSMLTSMLSAISDEKILGSIVDLVPVDVMNDIARSKLTPNEFFSDKAMLSDSLSGNPDAAVKLSGSSLRSLVSAVANLAAKEFSASSELVGLPMQGNSARRTGGVEGGHKPERILFIEEIQSDLHQEGRKKGYKGATELTAHQEARLKELSSGRPLTQDEVAELTRIRMRETGKVGVPDAPFKKTWQELALKRIIREAVEKGYDKVAWTTGEQQAERYDLSKSIDHIQWSKNKKLDPSDTGAFTIAVYDRNGKFVTEETGNADSLKETIGKELADKIVSEKRSKGVYKGLDLKVGGEGMKGFYDKILVDAANKLTKKFGGKVEETEIGVPTRDIYDIEEASDGGFQIIDNRDGSPVATADTEVEAKSIAESLRKEDIAGTKVHSLELTPALKESVLKEGFSLFQGPNDSGPRGQIEFGPYKALIKLSEKADASTFIHESFHLWTKEFIDDYNHLKTLDSLNDRQQQFMKDAETLLREVKAKSFEDLTTEQWEMIADAGEEYLREGKAPTPELQGVFQRFKTWLTYLYKTFRNSSVKLSADIRGVFDRMIAAEEASSQQAFDPLFKSAATEGMTEAQVAEYEKLQTELKQVSEAQLRSKLLDDLKRKQTAEYRAERAKVREQVVSSLNESPAYQAYSLLKDGTLPDGTELPEGMYPFKLSKEALIEAYGKEAVQGLPKGIFDNEAGLPADMAAEMLGFSSGEDLLHTLSNLPDKNSTIDELTNAQMKIAHPDLLEEPRLSDEAVKAANNDLKAQALRLELEHLASENLPALKGIIRKIARRVPTNLEVRAKAESMLSKLPISELSEHRYELAERRASKEAGELLAKGDIEGAYQAKNRELLNHELYKGSVRANDEIQKAVDLFKKVSKSDEDLSKGRDTDLVNAARALLAPYGLGRTKKTALEYLEKIKAYDPEKFATLSEVLGPAPTSPQDYQTLTLEAFRKLNTDFETLWSLARTENQIKVEGRMIDKAIAIEGIRSDLQKFKEKKGIKDKTPSGRTPTTGEKRKMMFAGARASGRIAESLIDELSLSDIDSNLRKYIFDVVNSGAAEYHDQKRLLMAKVDEVLQSLKGRLRMAKIDVPEIGFSFKNGEELFGALLHTGNESNLSKLLRGRGWGEYDEEGNLDRSRWDRAVSRLQQEGVLTPAHYDAAQSVWDLFESLKPQAQRAHHEVNGFYFNEITAKPFRAFGKDYRGGYVPAKIDPWENKTADVRQEKAAFEKIENAWAFPTTGQGFTKSRIDSFAAPLQMGLDHLPGALDWELRFIHIEPRVREVAKLLWDKETRDLFDLAYPHAVKEVLIPWLQRTSQQVVTFPSGNSYADRFVDSTARYLRASTQMQYLAFNLSSAGKRLSGNFPALLKVDASYLRDAYIDFTMRSRKTSTFINESSVYMRNASGKQLTDIHEAIEKINSNPNVLTKAHNFAKPFTSLFIKTVQHMMDQVIWNASYNQETARAPKGLTPEQIHDRAVRKADSNVRLTQGSSFPEHVSRWATGTPFQQFFKMFVNHFNTIGNLLISEAGQAETFRRQAYVWAVGFMGFAVSGALIEVAVHGASNRKDNEDWTNYLLRSGAGGILGAGAPMVAPTIGPAAGSVAQYLLNPNMKPADYHIEVSPVVSSLETGAKGLFEVGNAARHGKALKGHEIQDIFTLLGQVAQLPLAPVSKPISYVTDLNQGRIVPPKNPFEAARGFITGTAKKRKP